MRGSSVTRSLFFVAKSNQDSLRTDLLVLRVPSTMVQTSQATDLARRNKVVSRVFRIRGPRRSRAPRAATSGNAHRRQTSGDCHSD